MENGVIGVVAKACKVAAELHTDNPEDNQEYLAGQADLIADLFGFNNELTSQLITACWLEDQGKL